MKKLLILFLAIIAVSCQPEKPNPTQEQGEIGCGNVNDTTQMPDPVQTKQRLARFRMASTPTVTIESTFGNKYTNKAQKAKCELLLSYAKQWYAQRGISIAFNIKYIEDGQPNPYVGKSGFKQVLDEYKKVTNIQGDLGVYIDEGTGSGAAQTLGAIGSEDNRAVVLIPTTFYEPHLFSKALNALIHEIGHLLGSNHTYACVWPQGDLTGCALDNSGVVTGYGTKCRTGCVTPETQKYTIMSYGQIIKGASLSVMEMLPECLDVMKLHILNNASKLGCYNTAADIIFNKGKLTFDALTDSYRVKLFQYNGINGKLIETKVLAKTSSELKLFPVSTTTYVSGTPGFTFTFSEDVRNWDKLHYTTTKPLAAGSTMRSSTNWNGTASAGNTEINSNPFPITSYKMTKPANVVNLRPDKAVAGQVITAYLTKQGGSGGFEYTAPVIAGNYYYVEVTPECGGIARRDWDYTVPADWSGKVVYDSGGPTNLYYQNQDFDYYYPEASRVVFSEYYISDIGDYMQYSLDGGKTWVKLVHKFSGEIKSVGKGVLLNFKSNSSSNAGGYKFTPYK